MYTLRTLKPCLSRVCAKQQSIDCRPPDPCAQVNAVAAVCFGKGAEYCLSTTCRQCLQSAARVYLWCTVSTNYRPPDPLDHWTAGPLDRWTGEHCYCYWLGLVAFFSWMLYRCIYVYMASIYATCTRICRLPISTCPLPPVPGPATLRDLSQGLGHEACHVKCSLWTALPGASEDQV